MDKKHAYVCVNVGGEKFKKQGLVTIEADQKAIAGGIFITI